jgi:hypothetical protein
MTSISQTRAWLLAASLSAATALAAEVLRHDLFARPNRTSSVTGSESLTTWNPQLTAVLVAGDESLANVGGTIVKVGEEIDGYRLLRVQEGTAVFIKDGLQVVLTMNATPPAANRLRVAR